MILAVDVYYFEGKAKAVGILFEDWVDTQPKQTIEASIEDVAEYLSGEFYKRELPCIITLLNKMNLNEIETIIIDGYVYLNDDCKPGLGAHLYHYLAGKIPVIGVAKTAFYQNHKNTMEAVRGTSKNPLYVTAIGLPLIVAGNSIKNMAGAHRIPTLLKSLDRQTKICFK